MIRRFILFLLTLCGGMIWAQAQTNAFVNAAAANDNGDGLTWGTAKKTIAAALTVAGANGFVFVKAGNYDITSELTIPAGVTVMGGYSLTATGTDTTQRELPGLNSRWANASICTIINGSGTHRIATLGGLLEGCVLRLGFTTTLGGGVLLDGGTLRYCVVKECDAIDDNTLSAEGGGVYVRNGGLITNCVITECRGDVGPAVSGGNGTLINNTITRNWPTHCGKAVDYDGNVYGTVVLGQQCWTRQNMRSRHYNNGTEIAIGTQNSLFTPFYYVNYTGIIPSQLNQYGYLYNWVAAMNGAPASESNPSGVTGICPTGWHVPSDAEFVEMQDFVNTILSYRCSGYDLQIAKSLSSRTGWPGASGCNVGSNQSTNNRTLFNAYPAGYYDGGFSSLACANFWTTTSTDANAVAYYINYDNAYLNRDASANRSRARSVRCVKQLGITITPIVHTAGVTDITSTTASCGGTSSDGGNDITARGVCWSANHNPTINDSHTTDGFGEGSFTSALTGLTPGVTYYVRAYIIYSGGTIYGEERTFTPGGCGDLAINDYDGNTYGTVQIGDQCWMRENLRTTHFPNGIVIPNGIYYNNSSSSYYRNSNVDIETYGLFYNWTAAMNGASSSNSNPSGVQGVCPDGWHIPSTAEWEQLKNYLSGESQYWCNGDANNIGKSLAATTDWSNSNTNCHIGNNPTDNNSTGFNAIPAGYNYSYSNTSPCGTSNYACIWTSTEYSSSAYYYHLNFNSTTLTSSSDGKGYGYSVRCVKN